MSISLTAPTAFAELYEENLAMVTTIAKLVDKEATRVASGTEAELRQAVTGLGCNVVDLWRDPITSWFGLAEFGGNPFYFQAY